MKPITRIALYHRADVPEAVDWAARIRAYITEKHPTIVFDDQKPEAVVVLGGDGTVLDVAHAHYTGAIIFGLNLGHVGFLTAVRKPEHFYEGLERFLQGDYMPVKHMMLTTTVERNGKTIFKANALNEAAIQNLTSVAEMSISIDGHPVQHVKGTGVMVSTATGSTAWALSVHAPIVMPDIACFIISEIMDHGLPTPSLVIKRNRTISIRIESFRPKDMLQLKDGQPVDMLLMADSAKSCVLQAGDIVYVRRSPQPVIFAELDRHYFFKSVQETFGLK